MIFWVLIVLYSVNHRKKKLDNIVPFIFMWMEAIFNIMLFAFTTVTNPIRQDAF
jgi:hypothetical protein